MVVTELKWTDGAIERRMKEGWRGGLAGGTPCGIGCLPEHTKNIREKLPHLLRRFGISSVCDAGAGDLIWARETFAGFDYKAFDLVPRVPEVTRLDITKEALPSCDAILCRAVLIHLDPPRVLKALELFKQSARYLLASQYEVDNGFNSTKQFNRTNLRIAPYNLGEPLAQIQDLEEKTATLALWDLL